MKNLNERIKEIGKYFILMNVSPEAYYVLAQFPNKWVVPPSAGEVVRILKNEQQADTFYFYTDFNNSYDVLFDAIDEIIRQNREIEEKYKLFNEKLNELKTLFENENLSTLESMTFNMEHLENNEKLDLTPKTEPKVEKEEGELIEEETETPEPEVEEEVVPEEDVDKGKNKTKKKKNVGLSIMDAAKKMVTE